MDEDRCLSYGKQKEGMMTVLFLNVHILYDHCFFFFVFYTIRICTVYSFFPTVGHENQFRES